MFAIITVTCNGVYEIDNFYQFCSCRGKPDIVAVIKACRFINTLLSGMNPVFKRQRSSAMPLWEGKVSPPSVGQTLFCQELSPQVPSLVTLAGPGFQGSPVNFGQSVMCGTVLQPVNPSVMSSPVFISPVTRPLVMNSTKELRNSTQPETQGLTDMFFKLAAWKNGIKIGLEDKHG